MEKINAAEYEVFDGRGKIVGRLASTVAKRLLLGKKVAIINADESIMSGSKKMLMSKYKTRLTLQEKENPEHSPHWSRRPDFLVRRIVRGMLPYHTKPAGKEAYSRLVVYRGVPAELKEVKPIEIESKDPKALYTGYLKVADLSKLLGYGR